MAVTTIINDANDRTQSAIDDAQIYLDELRDLAVDNSIDLATNYFLALTNTVDKTILGPDAVPVDLPGISVVSAPTVTSAPLQRPVPGVQLWTDDPLEDFTAVPPTLTIPQQPTTPVPIAPPEPAAPRDITLPEFETLPLPDPPVLVDETIPNLDDLGIEAFDRAAPPMTLLPPANTFAFVEEEYSTGLLTALQALLEQDLVEGGYGINPADEQALWDRARDRSTKESMAAVAEVRRGTASRGFPLPPGSLYAAERAVLQEADANLSDTNRQIFLDQSARFVQARQFAVQQGIGLESALLNFAGAQQERALTAARDTANFALQFHAAEVTLYNLRLELRRLERDLHAQHLETVRTRIQAFEADLARAQTLDRRTETRVRLHESLLRAVEVGYQVQVLQGQRASIEADIERLKLQLSAERTSVFAAQVQARSDEFDAYATTINAERLRLDLYDQELATHRRKVDITLEESRRRRERFDAEIREQQLKLQHYSAEITKYQADLQDAALELEAALGTNDDIVQAWNSKLTAETANASNTLEHRIQQTRANLDDATQFTNYIQVALQAVNDHKELRAAAANSAMGLYEQLIAGAESSLSAIAATTEATS